MKLKLERTKKLPHATLGRLYLDSQFQCYTLEDTVRESKIQGETAIPLGQYRLVIDRSVRFGRLMPHLLEVPGFSGIRIHSGNTDKDTQGCILVGQSVQSDRLVGSKVAFNSLFEKLSQCQAPMTVQIVEAFEQ